MSERVLFQVQVCEVLGGARGLEPLRSPHTVLVAQPQSGVRVRLVTPAWVSFGTRSDGDM